MHNNFPIFYRISILLLFFLYPPFAFSLDIERRAVIHLAVHTVDLKIVDVHKVTQETVATVFETQIPLQLKESVLAYPAKDLDLQDSESILHSLKKLKKIANEQGSDKVCIVSAMALRGVNNFKQILKGWKKKLQLPFWVLAEKDEGYLYLLAAKEKLPKNLQNYPLLTWLVDHDKMLFASMYQGEVKIYNTQEGCLDFHKKIITLVKGRSHHELASPNPMSGEEIKKMLELAYQKASEHPQIAQLIFPSTIVVGLGTTHNYNLLYKMGLKSHYTAKNLDHSIQNMKGKKDEELGSPIYAPMELSNAALIRGYMQRWKISKVYPRNIHMIDGVFIHPEFWIKKVLYKNLKKDL